MKENKFLQKILILLIIAIGVITFQVAFASASVIIIPESEVTIYQPDTSFNPDWNASVSASSNYLNNDMIPSYSTSSTAWYFCSQGVPDPVLGTATCNGANSSAGMLTGGVPWYSAHPTAIRANNASQVLTDGTPYFTCYVETNYHCIPLKNVGGVVSYNGTVSTPDASVLSYTVNGITPPVLAFQTTPLEIEFFYQQNGNYKNVFYHVHDVIDPDLDISGTLDISKVLTSSSSFKLPTNLFLKTHKRYIYVITTTITKK